ncbi:MAG: PD40 domain-containing protein [Deltaproteobacteria bacterium]|nr:PD40 domain-containing protein [Deltaproteobacteria bacterium]
MSETRTLHRAALCSCTVAIVLGSLGCVGSVINLSSLPEDAIAVRLWENEEARRRKEMMTELESQSGTRSRLGVMDLKKFTNRSRSYDNADPSNRYPGRLALINPRTFEVTFPEEAPPGARPLSWSADRQRLIFSSNRRNGRFQIYELDFATGEVKLLSAGRGNVVAAAHGADSSFAFGAIQLGSDGELQMEILESRPGTRDRVLAEDVAIRHIAYSPDGRRVVYSPQSLVAVATGGRQLPRLVVQDVEPGGTRKELGPGAHPVFSPDGEWIVYSARRGSALRTYRVRVDGTGRTPLGETVRNEDTPAISPDGKFVVYVSDHNGLSRLFVKRFDGTGDRLLYDGAAVEWPIW